MGISCKRTNVIQTENEPACDSPDARPSHLGFFFLRDGERTAREEQALAEALLAAPQGPGEKRAAKQALKRPAAASAKTTAPPQAAKAAKTTKPDSANAAKPQAKPKSVAVKPPAGKTKAEARDLVSTPKCIASRAYHRAKAAALASGMLKSQAAEAARAAHREALAALRHD